MAQGHHQEQDALLVLQEQVLGVSARQLALELGALGHGEHRRVLDGIGGDPELGQAREQVLAGGRHGDARSWKLVKIRELAKSSSRESRPSTFIRSRYHPKLANPARFAA